MSPPPSSLRSVFRLSCIRFNPAIPPRAYPRSTFSTSTSAASSSPSSAHLIHPTTRQRLTNLTFYLCALVSIATVSLTMSGTLGDGKTLPCPARTRIGPGAESEREVEGAGASVVVNKGKGKSRGRWLEDPEGRQGEVWRAGKDGRLYKVEPVVANAATLTKDTRERRRIEDTKQVEQEEQQRESRPRIPPKERGIAWREWVGLGSR
ncbi:hypothetical protein JCM3766R1_005735 [Sporobolomyces carnicolor]